MITHYPTAEHLICKLAAACDGAHQFDGAGFNRNDTTIGKSLAEQVRQGRSWSNKQSQIALRLIIKYSRQLGGTEFIKDWARNPTFEKRPTKEKMPINTRKLYSIDKQAVFQFPYDAELVKAIKSIRGAHKGVKFYPCWDSVNKYWVLDVNEASIVAIMRVARDWEFDVEERFEVYYSRVMERMASLAPAAEESRVAEDLGYAPGVRVEGGEITVTHRDPAVLREFEAALGRL